MKYAHFLITRFNLPRLWVKDKNGESTQSEEWLEQRFELFKKYCLPSIVAQSSKNFIWLLLFYDKTPEKYKKFNEEMEAKYPFYKPCYLNDEESKDAIAYVNKVIHEMVSEDTESVITTRFDNDDSLAIDSMEEILDCAKREEKKQPYVISLYTGVKYHIKYNISVVVHYDCNHFISMVEPLSKNMKTMWCCNHVYVSKYYELEIIGKTKPMWMEVCHQRNVGNEIGLRMIFNSPKGGYDTARFALTPPPIEHYNLFLYRFLIIYIGIKKIIVGYIKSKFNK